MSIEFADIVLSSGKSKKRGGLTLSGTTLADAKFTFIFKAKGTNHEIPLTNVSYLLWCEVGRGLNNDGFAVKFTYQNNQYLKFSGFQASAYNTIQSWLQQFGKELVIEKVSTRGANWGKLNVSDHRLVFEDKEGLLMFDIPVMNISQTTFQGKQDISIEFPQDDDPKSLAAQMETLCDIRIFVPNDETAKPEKEEKKEAAADGEPQVKTEDGEEKKEGEEGEEGEDQGAGEEEETPAQILVKDIMSRLGGDDRSIQPIAKFDLMFQSPRGKYVVDMYPAYLKLYSKTFQYKILYKYVQKMFLFDHVTPNNSPIHYFIIQLNPPIRQGRTSHPFLLVQFDGEEADEMKLNLDEAVCMEKYKGLIHETMKGPKFDIITRVMKALTERPVIIPGKGFTSMSKTACVRCSLKASDGYLYCLEKSFFFVKKPLMQIRHQDITDISFERLSNSSTGSKTFDLRITTIEEKNNEHVFSGISRDEYPGLFGFLKTKKLKISSSFVEGVRPTNTTQRMLDDDSSQTSTSAHGRSRTAANYDEDLDPHLNRIHDENEGSDSEEDSDFEGGGSSSSSESGSDVESEASDSDMEAPKKKKKAKNVSSGDEDEEGEEGPKKKGQKRKRGEKSDKKKATPAKSAYFFYLDEARPKLLADKPELKGQMVKLTGELAAQWRALSDEDKAPYNAMAEAAKVAKAAERADMIARGEISDEEPKKKKTSSKKRSGEPKAPPTAQRLYAETRKAELKKEDPSLSGKDIQAKVNEEWKTLEAEQKQTYVEKHLELKKQYKIDLDAWKEKHPDDGSKKSSKKSSEDAMEDGEEKENDEGDDGGEDEAARKAARKARKEAKKAKKEAKKAKKEKKSKKEKKKDKKSKEDASASENEDAEMAPAEEEEPQVKAEPMEE